MNRKWYVFENIVLCDIPTSHFIFHCRSFASVWDHFARVLTPYSWDVYHFLSEIRIQMWTFCPLEYNFVQLDVMISTSPTFWKNMLLRYSGNICFVLKKEAAVYSENVVNFPILHCVIFRKSAILAVTAVRISKITDPQVLQANVFL
jgi:hypothetical protein